jgi:hypothetical protein
VSEDTVCCPLSGNDEGTPECYDQRNVTAKRAYECDECSEPIARGVEHERVKGIWFKENGWSTYRTCLSCVEIRDHFSCGHGWMFESLWEDLQTNFFPEMKAGGPCMKGLSPAAKARLFERRLKWLEDKNG